MTRLVSIGDKYNRLLVVSHDHTDHHYRKFWRCVCDCGNMFTTHSGSLRSGNTKSCGCLAREVKDQTRKPDNGSELTAVILGYKRHAYGRGFDWGLQREQVRLIIGQPCHYCGAKPSNKKSTKNSKTPFMYSGIDRLDNLAGYSPANVVPCCATCNRAKGTLTVQDFSAWVKRINAFAEQWGKQ
jgi:hypothetical protein